MFIRRLHRFRRKKSRGMASMALRLPVGEVQTMRQGAPLPIERMQNLCHLRNLRISERFAMTV